MAQPSRVLLVFALHDDDPELAAQRAAVAGVRPGMVERDLILVEEIGPDANRSRYGVASSGFAVLLIGRDGGVKLRSDHPMSAQTLFGTIDTMPMRQSEIRHQ